ncbi:hypothetical protein CLV35_2364 [Motilibacter peucedani]|uniref:Uncharacterized protein n=1 Tax=Motilibacter peucedani TaxID=598650 RepID=A0A420XNT7_9ACTN|nr:hypothetical protein [Motilibacter peucedani]RKS73870.1 hypothetical protein CLV35_2364 [Motilibacter peucedani]
MTRLMSRVLAGAAAGAAGTTALNAITYLDMVVRARPASSTPEKTVEALADRLGVTVPGDDDQRQARVAGLGPLTGIAAGVSTGALLGVLRALGVRPGPVAGSLLATGTVLVASNGPMTTLGVTDPREWSAGDWVSDVVPHAGYAVVTTAVLRALDRE